jgi:hypothetical protein
MHRQAGILDQGHRDFARETPGQLLRLDDRLGHCAPRKMSTGCTLAALRAGNRPAQRAAPIAKAAAIANCGQFQSIGNGTGSLLPGNFNRICISPSIKPAPNGSPKALPVNPNSTL